MPSISANCKVSIIDVMLANDGCYPGDPQALQISEYTNNWGGQTYHIAFDQNDLHSLMTSPAVRNVKVLWKRGQS